MTSLSDEDVLHYLKENPGFLKRHPEAVEFLKTPVKKKDGNVLDFQAFAISHLQQNIQETKEQYEDLISSAQDNSSVQRQVHQAIIKLVRAKTLEQLLEVITLDLVQLFNVDVVRLAMESDMAGIYDTSYPDTNYSGIVFIDAGVTDAMMGKKGMALLCADIHDHDIAGIDTIFADCDWLVRSVAILRLQLSEAPRNVVLAFGVRETDRFHQEQAVDLLIFLGQIIQECLDTCLRRSGIDPIL
jgi:uncharacterized protein YigA (DUF484 family)